MTVKQLNCTSIDDLLASACPGDRAHARAFVAIAAACREQIQCEIDGGAAPECAFGYVLNAMANVMINAAVQAGGDSPAAIASNLAFTSTSLLTYSRRAQLEFLPAAGEA